MQTQKGNKEKEYQELKKKIYFVMQGFKIMKNFLSKINNEQSKMNVSMYSKKPNNIEVLDKTSFYNPSKSKRKNTSSKKKS